MIGVVVWADTARNKAVIWCEDQRDLAYYLPSAEAQAGTAPGRGDLVEFDARYKGTLRIAENVTVVEANSRTGLGDALRGGSTWARRSNIHRGAQVTSLSIPDRVEQDRNAERPGDRPAARRDRDAKESAKILPFPELMRA